MKLLAKKFAEKKITQKTNLLESEFVKNTLENEYIQIIALFENGQI